MAPGFPAVVAEEDDFADATIGLLADDAAASALAAAASDHVEQHYRPHAWQTWATEVLRETRPGP
jgi:hypothetical protein